MRSSRLELTTSRGWFADVVYVLHAFQKKSKAGIKTPMDDMNLTSERLKQREAWVIPDTASLEP